MSRPRKTPGQYAGRAANRIPVGFSLDRHAVALLRSMAGSPKTCGQLITTLIYCEAARREARGEGEPATPPLSTEVP